MKIIIDISDETKAVIERLTDLVDRLDAFAKLIIAAAPTEEPVPTVATADFGECVQIPVVPDSKPEPSLYEQLTEAVEENAVIPRFKGKSADDKISAWLKMKEYRTTHGLGCWKALGDKLGRSDAWLRSVYAGEIALPVEEWRKIGAALEEMGKK